MDLGRPTSCPLPRAAVIHHFSVRAFEYDAYLPDGLTRIEGRGQWTVRNGDGPSSGNGPMRRPRRRRPLSRAHAAKPSPTAHASRTSSGASPCRSPTRSRSAKAARWSCGWRTWSTTRRGGRSPRSRSPREHSAASTGRGRSAPSPHDDWLVTDWAHRQSEPVDIPAARAEVTALAETPAVRSAIGRDAGPRVTRMLEDQDRFIDGLARLPETLCHHDAARSKSRGA